MIPKNLIDEGSTDVPSDCDSCDECADDAYFSELNGDGEERDKFACPCCCMLRAEKWAERAKDVVCEASTWKTTEPLIENGLAEANAAEDDCVKAARREKRRIAAAADAVRQERRRTAGLPKVGVRQKRVPMTPEQDDSIKDQHKWETVQPEKRVMKIVGQLLWVARCTRTDVSYPVS